MQPKRETKAQLFSRKVIALRNDLGLTQEELAQKVGSSRKSVQNWESEKSPRVPHGETLRRLAQVLGRSVEHLLSSEDSDAAASISEAVSPYGNDRMQCHEYLSRVLDACGDDKDRIVWVKVQLKQHFPLSQVRAMGEPDPTMKTFVDAIAGTALAEEVRKLRPTDTTASTSGKTSAPASTAPPAKDVPRDVPDPAPK